MGKRALLFGIHMHQPVDNFDEAVDQAVSLCYRPFFETMIKYPQFKFSLHCSGWLLDTLRKKYPELFEMMRTLTESNSIEWITAGYYEPILSAIPSRDRVAQIKLLNKFLKKHFGVKAQGLWLTERVWESAIIPDLVSAGVEFALVDDYHFLSSGYDAKKMDGYYLSEEGAEELKLFPISQALRYALPFYSPQRAIDAILSSSKEGAAVIFDDAEKFGLWPKTYEWVYEKKWLEHFVEAVLAEPKIQTQHYSEYIQKNRSYGIAYLHNTSYFEMGEWSLQATEALKLEKLKESVALPFLQGGIWKNFFLKYLESNYLHKRMLYWSKEQESLSKVQKKELYKLQTNDVFWHGVFGGLYLPNLRDNAYRYLLALEKSKVESTINFEYLDIDKDAYEELKVRTQKYSAVFSAKHGGQMLEFGSLDSLFNWQNTLMRRKEAYHEKILNPQQDPLQKAIQRDDEIETIHSDTLVMQENLRPYLIFDWHPKFSFIDHFALEPFSLENFVDLSYNEIGDFANQAFDLDKQKVCFKREGGLYLEQKYATSLEKCYTFAKNSFHVNIDVMSCFEEELYYAVELNLHFAHPHETLFNTHKIDEGLMLKSLKNLEILDPFTQQKLLLTFSQECDFYAHLLATVSQSEAGFDKVVQGISILLTLVMQKELQFSIGLELADV